MVGRHGNKKSEDKSERQKQGRENELDVGRRNSQCPFPLVYYLQWGSISLRLHHLRQHDQLGTNLLNTWTYLGPFLI